MQREAAIREPLILGDKSYKDITDDVVGPIQGVRTHRVENYDYHFQHHRRLRCWVHPVPLGHGNWSVGSEQNCGLGMGHHQLCLVGWHWTRWHLDFRRSCLLFRQKWRMAINRSAEAMTIFAVIMAAIFPGIHMGRIWVSYWVLPLPNQFGSLWVNFNSPLLWDVFAISQRTSPCLLVFWYIGLIPDFATIRDRMTKPFAKKAYGLLSFGWSGRAKHWNRFEEVSLVLGGNRNASWFSRSTPSYPWTLRPRSFRVGTRPSSRPTSFLAQYSLASRWFRRCS